MEIKQTKLRGVEGLLKEGNSLTVLNGTLTFMDGSFEGQVNIHLDVPEILELVKKIDQGK